METLNELMFYSYQNAKLDGDERQVTLSTQDDYEEKVVVFSVADASWLSALRQRIADAIA